MGCLLVIVSNFVVSEEAGHLPMAGAALIVGGLRSLFLRCSNLARDLITRGLGSRMVSGFVIVAMLTVVSKAASFVKDATVAGQFGINDDLDAFMFSFALLTFIAALVGGGLPEAFLPKYAEVMHQKSPDRAKRLAVQSSLLHALMLLATAAVLFVLAPFLVGWTTRGFSAEKQALAVDVMRELLPFMACLGISYQLGTWLRADKHFTVAAAAPMAVPLVIILWLLVNHETAEVSTLVHGTLAGGVLHLGILIYVLWRRDGLSPSFVLSCLKDWEPEVRGVLRGSVPFLVAGAIFNMAVVIDQAMASWLEAGSVSVLSYSDKVCGIVLAVTAAPSCEVLFPYFADKVARRDWLGVKRQLLSSAGIILVAALPAALLLSLLAPWIIALLFERGSFTAENTQRVADVLRFAALQIPFYILGSLATRVVVAMQATRFIIVLASVAVVGNAIFNWLLMQRYGAAGIALSTVLVQMISAAMSCMFVLRMIRRKLDDPGASERVDEKP
jgi:putative peptidoglycan lipid II flippase